MMPVRPMHGRRLAGLLAAVALGSTACGTAPTPTASPGAVALASDLCTGRTCTTVPDLTGMTAARARAALAGVNLVVTGELTAQADDVTITAQSPGPGTTVPMGTVVSLSYGTPVAPAPARTISAADWAGIAKEPAAHTGERIVVHGRVTQFDPETDVPTFRAAIDGVVHQASAEYATDAFLTGTPELLGDLVARDLFTAEVTVTSPYSYETTAGGTVTVPTLEITALTVTGTVE